MKTEKQFSDFVCGKLCIQYSVQSFENSSIQSIPDLYLVELGTGCSIWMELKIEKDNRMSFMQGQPKWIERHKKNGGLAFVLCLHKNNMVSLCDGDFARKLSQMKMDSVSATGLAIEELAIVYGPLSHRSTWMDILGNLASLRRKKWSM